MLAPHLLQRRGKIIEVFYHAQTVVRSPDYSVGRHKWRESGLPKLTLREHRIERLAQARPRMYAQAAKRESRPSGNKKGPSKARTAKFGFGAVDDLGRNGHVLYGQDVVKIGWISTQAKDATVLSGKMTISRIATR